MLYAIPGHRSPGQMMGRAKAGLAQLAKKKYNVMKLRVVTTSTSTNYKYTYIQGSADYYMQRCDDIELQEVLMEVGSILQNSQYVDVVWGSDLNWDPSRNSQFSRSLFSFIQETGLVSLLDEFPVPTTHTHTERRSR